MSKTDQSKAAFRSSTIIVSAIVGLLLLSLTFSATQAAEFSLFESVKNILEWQSPSLRSSVLAPPTLGNYANTTIALSGNTTITPTSAPTNAVSATATTNAAFKGELEVDSTTGIVRVTNAHPANRAGEFYPVTVTAYNADGATTKTFNLTVTTPAGCNAFVPLSFAEAANIFVGNTIASTAVGDFNGDGRQDIVSATYNNSSVSVLLRNAANNGFDPGVNFTVGSNPKSVAVGDFNGDGKQDIVTANYTNHNVSVLLRNAANNGFDTAVNLTTGTNPISVAVGDFNGDGRQDIVTANYAIGVNAVSVLLRNAANNGFDAKVDYVLSNRPMSVTVADFNGDGRQDIAALNGDSNGVVSVLLRNAANNGFDPKADFTASFSPQSIAAGDFNGDGKQDVVTASLNSNNVSVLLRNAANTGFDAKVDYGVSDNPISVAVADFNNDGRQDIVTANWGTSSAGVRTNNVSVLIRNPANNGFNTKVDFTAGTSSAAAVAVGDFNGDNRQDIAAPDSVRVYVLQRVCNNSPGFTGVTNQIRAQGVSSNSQIATVSDPETAAGSLTVTATSVPSGITVSNIVNTNGTITATVGAAGNTPTGDYTVVLTVSDGELSTNANLTVTVVFPTQEIVVKGSSVIITDGDTTPSLADTTDFGSVALTNTRERTFTIENVGATALTIQNVTVTGGQAAAFSVIQQPAASLQLFATTTFKIRFTPTATGLHSTTVSFGNNDADENPFNFTIQATGITPPTLGDYTNTSIALGGNTTITPNAAPTNLIYATATTSPDFKGELEVDPTTGVVRVTNAHPANRAGETYLVTVRAFNAGGATTKTFNLTVTTTAGCGTFNSAAFASSSYSATSAASLAVGDFNGDGKQDIVAGRSNSGNNVRVLLRNAANTGFDAAISLTTGAVPSSVAVGDFNGDGKADIVSANNTDNTVSVLLRNAANNGFDTKVDYAVGSSPAGVAVGDFNGDGKADIATSNVVANTISVLLRNEANDGFDAKVDYTAATNPAKIAIGDFNGDGKSDIVAANYGSGVNSVSVFLRNAANNGFDTKVDYAFTNRPYGVAVGDFNGDGKHDIVATNSGSGSGQDTVSVMLRNAANNGFDAAASYVTGVFSFAVAVGDFNHDGKQDIAAPAQIPGKVAVLLRNAANNGFDAKVDFGSSDGHSVAVGDFNGDNRQDIVTVSSNVIVLQRVCNNAPTFASVSNQTRLQGNTTNSQIAVVSDAETAAGSLTVTATSVPSGITVSNIVNTNGAITADVGAAVNTPAGDYTVVLSAFDGELSTNANLIVTVTPIAQEVIVRGNNVIVTDGDVSPSLTDHTDFGSVALTNTRERTFTIENIGANALTIQNVTISGGQPAAFTVTQQPTSPVAQNGSTTFKIRFAPTVLGLQSTTISFGNNDADENPFDFTIQATGITAPTLGDYANTSIALGGNTTITPNAVPTNNTYATATTSADFKGELEVDPTTGVVRVTNAHPGNRLNETYPVTVTAYNVGGATTKTFNLTVTTPTICPLFDATAFAPVVNSTVNLQSVSIAVGDFNADGKQDVVTVNHNNISVLLRNAANNGFDAKVDYSIGFGGRSAAVADFNGDGKQDIVVATSGTGNTVVSVFLRNAANTGFDANIDYPAGSNPRSVSVGDFNGDGKYDIVAANGNPSGTVSVLFRNAANNGFDSPVSFAVGANPGSPAVADFNADGKQDIVVANSGGSVSVLLRNGANEGFDSAVDYVVGGTPGSVAAGDFNADGKQDIVAAISSLGSNNISVLLRNAANNGFDPAVDYVVSNSPFSVAVGDFNNDGKQDIVTANYNASTISVLIRNAANNGFAAKVDSAVGSNPYSVAVGDFNADRKQDIVAVNNGNNSISVLERGNCPPAIAPAIGLTRQQSSAAANSEIAAVDDFETPAGNLAVQATTVPTGITVSNLVNNNGTITADIAASCTATTGNNTVVLTVTDADNASTSANLIVNVTANTPPTLVYPNTSVTSNGSTTINPSTATDNVGISSYSLQSQGTYTGTISVNSATGAVSISNAAPLGAHTITIRATDNCGATTDAGFTLTVSQPPAINSANNTTFTVGAAGSFTFTATGTPTPAISKTGALPIGVTFTDNGNGTASLTGTPAAGTGGSYPLTITASNGVSPNAAQSFTLTVNQAPVITSANSTTFTQGTSGSFQATATGFPAPTFSVFSGTTPNAVTLNTTGLLSGAPTQSGTFTFTIRATNAAGTNNQSFTLTILQPSISGIVSYGIIPANQSQKLVQGVLLSATGTITASGTSNSAGVYLIENLTAGGNYTVTASKTTNKNGITAFDATLILRCVAAGANCALTTNQRIAADSDNNTSITAFDATQILRYVAANGSNANTGVVGNWKFNPISRPYTNLTGNQSNQDYTAFLIGEIDGDWTP